MNTLEPFRIHQIDLNQITYTKIKNEPSKNKRLIYIKYQDNKPLVFQCAPLLNENTPVKITDDYYELDIPLITEDRGKQSKLTSFFKALDKKIHSDAKKNAKMWFDGQQHNTYTMKTIIKDSPKHKEGSIKIKVIKTPAFETLLLFDNKKKIQIKDVPKNSWVKILLEIFAIVINTENKTFYLFLRPVALSFREKENTKYNYTFLDDSDENNDIPDSDVNDIFLKQTIPYRDGGQGVSSSQINLSDSNIIKNLELNTSNNFSNSSSDELKELTDSESSEDDTSYKKNKLENVARLSDSSPELDESIQLAQKLNVGLETNSLPDKESNKNEESDEGSNKNEESDEESNKNEEPDKESNKNEESDEEHNITPNKAENLNEVGDGDQEDILDKIAHLSESPK